ncbi:hypothetical protein SE17_27085 [Kouleothrix aurantiaca]|uniref:Uncharacterized protein n=1 Tax=Kouleothrix aurantiaca TaxID=186479 RepID=A0A0P9CWF8_9CHLR|nr:hypothetical protein SE17_27085 [Kouleothrix aurantiaca]
MTHDLLLPPFLALLLCCFLGYPLARLALPAELRAERWLLVPLLGLALLLNVCAALTTTTALRPLQIALGMAALALPLNLWLLFRGKNRIEGRIAIRPDYRACNLQTFKLATCEPAT